MGCSYEVRDGMLFVNVEGTFDVTDCMRTFDEGTTDPEYRRGMNVIIDCRRADSSPAAEDVRMASGSLNPLWSRISGKFAIVVATTLHYGLGRMFAMYANRGEESLQVFRDMDEALKWLRSPAGG